VQSYWGGSVIISASGHRVAFSATAVNLNQVKVYEYNDATSVWEQLGNTLAGTTSYRIGLVLSGNADLSRIAIATISNTVDVYYLYMNVWTQLGSSLTTGNSPSGALQHVALSGDGSKLVVSHPGTTANGTASGQFRLFELSGFTWVQVGSTVHGSTAQIRMGTMSTISYDGSKVIVSSPGNNRVSLYTWNELWYANSA
jgi:uncharacterized membrane protein